MTLRRSVPPELAHQERREGGFFTPAAPAGPATTPGGPSGPTDDLVKQFLASQLRTEEYLRLIAEKLAGPSPNLPRLDQEALSILGVNPGGELANLFHPSMLSGVIAVGRVTATVGGFTLQDDTKSFNEEVIGKTIILTSGPGAGERRVICALGAVNTQVRILRSFRSRPTANTTYAILESSTYGSMFESTRTWVGISTEQVNDGNANQQYPAFINLTGRGVIVHVNVANIQRGGMWSPRVEIRDFLNNAIEIFRPQHWIDDNGDFWYMIWPDDTGPNYRGMNENCKGPFPVGSWQVRLVPFSTTPAYTADIYFDAQYLA